MSIRYVPTAKDEPNVLPLVLDVKALEGKERVSRSLDPRSRNGHELHCAQVGETTGWQKNAQTRRRAIEWALTCDAHVDAVFFM